MDIAQKKKTFCHWAYLYLSCRLVGVAACSPSSCTQLNGLRRGARELRNFVFKVFSTIDDMKTRLYYIHIIKRTHVNAYVNIKHLQPSLTFCLILQFSR